jgi:hypothetical protein
VEWPEDATREQRTPGVHHCPFDDDPRKPDQLAQRKAWLEGLKARLSAPTKDPKEILSDIDAELKEAK